MTLVSRVPLFRVAKGFGRLHSPPSEVCSANIPISSLILRGIVASASAYISIDRGINSPPMSYLLSSQAQVQLAQEILEMHPLTRNPYEKRMSSPKPIWKERQRPKTDTKRDADTELMIRKAPLVVCKITFMTRGKVVRGIQDSFASFRRIVHHLRPPFIGFPIWIWIS